MDSSPPGGNGKTMNRKRRRQPLPDMSTPRGISRQIELARWRKDLLEKSLSESERWDNPDWLALSETIRCGLIDLTLRHLEKNP